MTLMPCKYSTHTLYVLVEARNSGCWGHGEHSQHTAEETAPSGSSGVQVPAGRDSVACVQPRPAEHVGRNSVLQSGTYFC